MRFVKKYHNIAVEEFGEERALSRSLDIDLPANKLIKINKVNVLMSWDGLIANSIEDIAVAICRVDKKRPVGIENFDVWTAYDEEILGVTTYLKGGVDKPYMSNDLTIYPRNTDDNYSDVPRFILYVKSLITEVMKCSIVLNIEYDLIPSTVPKLAELERLKNLVGGSTQDVMASSLNDIGTIDLTP